MTRDPRDTLRAVPRPRPGFSRRASRSPPHSRGKPPVAAIAWPWFAPDPALPASPHGPPNNATPPKSAPPPARISRSIGICKRRADTSLPLAKGLPEQACPSPAAQAIPAVKSAPSIVLHHRRHQPRCKVLRHSVQCGVLLFKKVLNAAGITCVRRNLILVAKNKIVRVIENLSRLALFKRDLALQRNQHGR